MPHRPKTLLLADDEHLVASGMATNLRDLGFTVLSPAANGEEAIERCQEERPDMALLDIRMPKMDGLEAAEVIFKRLGIPVVIFSAFADQEYIDAGNRAGIFNYLLKPISQDELRVGVTVAWGRFLDYANQDCEIGELKQRLENRKIIEQAKWLIVKHKNIPEPEAMKLLQRQARNNRRLLIEVARGIIENEQLMNA